MEVIIGKKSDMSSSLRNFEAISRKTLAGIVSGAAIPTGFMFLAGVKKYGSAHCQLRCGKDYFFIQKMTPYHSENGIYTTRGYGALYAFYEPEKMYDDDIVLSESAIYQLLPENRIKLVLGHGEHLQESCIAKMFADIRKERNLLDFAPEKAKPQIFEVTFKQKSCGYFLKGRTYLVWAMPVGRPDEQTGEIVKQWIFCDINCGIPAIIDADREEFIHIPVENGSKVGLFTYREGNLFFEERGGISLLI